MLVFFFLSVAVLQAGWADEMVGTSLGRALLAVLAGFWVVRAALQFVFWAPLPRGTNLAFTTLFLLGAGLHLAALRLA